LSSDTAASINSNTVSMRGPSSTARCVGSSPCGRRMKSWPVSVQQAFVQLGLMVAFVIAGHLGTAASAVINVLIALSTVPAQTSVALGTAAATLVGQSLGRGDEAAARTWGWRTVGVGLIVTGPLGLLAVVAPHLLLAPFLRDPNSLAMAILPARILGLGIVADTAARIICFAIRGAGATRIGALIPFVSQWIVQLPLAASAALWFGMGILGLVAAQSGVALAEVAVAFLVWRGSSWSKNTLLANNVGSGSSGPI
jgi:MATE family multidrug resistance protein